MDARPEHFPTGPWGLAPRFPLRRLVEAATRPAPARAASGSGRGYELTDGVALIPITGPLTKYGSAFGPAMLGLSEAVSRAAKDEAANVVLLYLDSPGGEVRGVSDLADAVYAARKAKPVVAYASDLCASCAYYVASQADRIYCDPDAQVGGIGTYMVVEDWSQALADAGIKVHRIASSPLKGAGAFGTEVTDEHLAEWQREIDAINATFIAAVARGRGWPESKAAALADGRLHVGAGAVAVGLVDAVRPWDEVLGELAAKSTGREPQDLLTWR